MCISTKGTRVKILFCCPFFNPQKVLGWGYYSQRNLKRSGATELKNSNWLSAYRVLFWYQVSIRKLRAVFIKMALVLIYGHRDERTSRQTKYMLCLAFFFRLLNDVMIRQKLVPLKYLDWTRGVPWVLSQSFFQVFFLKRTFCNWTSSLIAKCKILSFFFLPRMYRIYYVKYWIDFF